FYSLCLIKSRIPTEIDKLMALISMSFKKIYKPTNNNLKTLSNTRNLNFDNTPRSSRGTGTQVVQQTRIQCYSYKEFRHVARECQNLKRARDSAYRQEKMLLCKQEGVGIQILEVTPDAADNSEPIFDDEPLQKVHNNDDEYNVFANKKQHPEQPESVNETYLMEQDDTYITHDSSDTSNKGDEANQDDQMMQKEH
nr:hypothetical protein [Tanacetum cinerariifolium]